MSPEQILTETRQTALDRVATVTTPEQLETIRVEVLGRNGTLAAISKTFGKLAILSPSVWWDDLYVCRQVEKLASRPMLKIWLDIGVKEGEDAVEPARKLRAALVAKGWKEAGDLRYVESEGAEHNERAWAARFPEVLTYLFSK